MDELEKVLNLLPEVKESLGHAAKERASNLKKIRKKVTSAGLDPTEIDEELEMLKGTKEKRGLFSVLDVQEEQKASEPDPRQRDIEDKPDYRTHDLTTKMVRELVASEIEDKPAVEAIRILNALEDGEKDRDPRPRDSVIQVIADARSPLVAKVDKLEVVH